MKTTSAKLASGKAIKVKELAPRKDPRGGRTAKRP